jgi:DNA helicase MCM8
MLTFDCSFSFFPNFKLEMLSTNAVVLDYPTLRKKFNDKTFETALVECPEQVLNSLGVALHSILLRHATRLHHTQDPHTREGSWLAHHTRTLLHRRLNVRLCNYTPLTPLRQLKSCNIGKFVGIKGTVIRVSNIKPLVVGMPFQCGRCGHEFFVSFIDGKFTLPERCMSENRCRSKTFLPIKERARTVDWQKVRLQEYLEASVSISGGNGGVGSSSSSDSQGMQIEAGRVPRTIEVELREDLVDSVTPGDVVTLSGIVKVAATEARLGHSFSLTLYSSFSTHNFTSKKSYYLHVYFSSFLSLSLCFCD